MKTNKPKVHKKDAKKAEKKELSKTLKDKFLQLMKEMGQEAEKNGIDINKVGLSALKKISAKLSEEKPSKKSEAHKGKQDKKMDNSHAKPIGKTVADEVKITKKTPEVASGTKAADALRKVVIKGRPAAQSVKVVPILSEENAAKALSKKTVVKKTTRAPRKTKTDEDVNLK